MNKKATAFRIASVSLCFFLSLFAPAHVQAATSGAAIGALSPLSAMAHDFATWLNHVAGRGANNHRAGRHPSPLPGQVASHPVTSPARRENSSHGMKLYLCPESGLPVTLPRCGLLHRTMQVTHAQRSAADCAEYRQAAGGVPAAVLGTSICFKSRASRSSPRLSHAR